MIRLWAANPHQFGQGKVHVIDDRAPERTMCGRLLVEVDGREVFGGSSTCKVCAKSIVTRAEEEKWRAESERRRAEYQAEAEEKDRLWRERYNEHLRSPKWRETADMVLRRAGGVCEGCGKRPATQVHHRTYDNLGDEFLFELLALCRGCHERVHHIGNGGRP